MELVHVEKGKHELLDGSKHRKLLSKAGRSCEPAQQNPRIVYECLRLLLNSALNRAGFLLIYIRTQNNLLIEVNPQLKAPDTFHEFESVFGTLMIRNAVRAKEMPLALLRIIKNDIDHLLPANCQRIGVVRNGEGGRQMSDGAEVPEFVKGLIKTAANGHPVGVLKNPMVNDAIEQIPQGNPVVIFVSLTEDDAASTQKNADVEQHVIIDRSVRDQLMMFVSAFTKTLNINESSYA